MLCQVIHWFDQWTHKAWPIDSVMMLLYFLVRLGGPTKKENNMTTSLYESLSLSKWDWKYHMVFLPKNKKKVLYGKIRKFLGPLFMSLPVNEIATLKGEILKQGTQEL